MRSQIIEILKELRPDITAFEGVHLIDEGILDSFDIVSLMLDLNEAFNTSIGLESITKDNFSSIDSIESMIQKAI